MPCQTFPWYQQGCASGDTWRGNVICFNHFRKNRKLKLAYNHPSPNKFSTNWEFWFTGEGIVKHRLQDGLKAEINFSQSGSQKYKAKMSPDFVSWNLSISQVAAFLVPIHMVIPRGMTCLPVPCIVVAEVCVSCPPLLLNMPVTGLGLIPSTHFHSRLFMRPVFARILRS